MFARRTKATGAAQSINERRAHLHQERRSRSLRQLKRLPKEKAHEGPLGMDASSVTAPTGSTEPTEPRRCNPSFHIPPPARSPPLPHRPLPAVPQRCSRSRLRVVGHIAAPATNAQRRQLTAAPRRPRSPRYSPCRQRLRAGPAAPQRADTACKRRRSPGVGAVTGRGPPPPYL